MINLLNGDETSIIFIGTNIRATRAFSLQGVNCMEILLNPNILYLLLVFGFSLSTLALLSPGTGIIEIFALFALLFAGYGVYNVPFNLWALIILIFGFVAFILSVRKSKQAIFLILTILLFIVGSIYLFPGEEWWQPAVNPLLAIVVSILLSVFFWIVIRKILEAELSRPSHDLEALIGEVGEAKSDINKEGSVQVDGELWSAFSDQKIKNGSMVRVVNREGFILKVEKVR